MFWHISFVVLLSIGILKMMFEKFGSVVLHDEGESNDMGVGDSIVTVGVDVLLGGNNEASEVMGGANEIGEVMGGSNEVGAVMGGSDEVGAVIGGSNGWK